MRVQECANMCKRVQMNAKVFLRKGYLQFYLCKEWALLLKNSKMNYKQEALGGSSRLSDEAMLVRIKTILTALTDNDYFPDPVPALDELQEAYEVYEEKLSAAKRRGSPQDTAEKDRARKNLAAIYKQLAFYVNQVSEGNLAMLLSSGFEVTQPPKVSKIPLIVSGGKLKDGRQSGQVRLDFDKNKEALFYEYEVGIWEQGEPEPDWEQIYRTTSSRQNIIAPLEPLQRYAVRIRAVNGKGESDWSELITHIVR